MQLETNVKNIHAVLTKDRLVRARTDQAQTVIGLTEAIRTVMRSWGKPMTTREVRLGLVATGFDLGRFRNPSAAIANTLIRMVRGGELDAGPSKTYGFRVRNAELYGGVPNPFGKNLTEMLKEPKGK